MYSNGNFESHMAAMCFLGTAGLTLVLLSASVVLFVTRRRWARYPVVAAVGLLGGYGLMLGFLSYASYDRTAKRGDEKFFCGLDCHIAYSVQNVERMKSVGDVTAQGEFVVVTVRSHFDERTIAPRRGNSPLTPDPPEMVLLDGSGCRYGVSAAGQKAWEAAHAPTHSLRDPLRPGESYETTWVFEAPAGDGSLRMFAGWHGFPENVLIGDEASPGHGKTYFAL